MAGDPLRSLYDSLRTRQDLQKLISDREKESIHLEFKTKKDRSHGKLEDSERFQFSRALSGFANSDGGILVWGIETDENEEAKELKPVTDIAEFHAAIKKSLLNSTQAVVDNVLVDVISEDNSAGSGYLKCFIPASEKTPHRAMLANREYYKRTTEGFYRLEHFDLEDMFGRRPHPSLTLYLELRSRPGDDPHEELHFGLINSGRGIAKHAGLLCRFRQNIISVAGVHGLSNLTSVNHGLPTVGYADNMGVIHPTGVVNFVGHAILRQQTKGLPIHVNVSWYCENMAMRSHEGDVVPEKG